MLRITYVGAAFLALVAVIPSMVQASLGRGLDHRLVPGRHRAADRHQRLPRPGAEDRQPPGHAELHRAWSTGDDRSIGRGLRSRRRRLSWMTGRVGPGESARPAARRSHGGRPAPAFRRGAYNSQGSDRSGRGVRHHQERSDVSSHRGMASRPSFPLLAGLARRPKAAGRAPGRIVAAGHQAEEPARDRADARGGPGRGPGARRGPADGRAGGHHRRHGRGRGRDLPRARRASRCSWAIPARSRGSRRSRR